MIISASDLQQDTSLHKNTGRDDSLKVNSDSASHVISLQLKDSVKHKSITFVHNQPVVYTDTISVCSRNSITDVTFYNYSNFIFRIGFGTYKQFPYIFTDKVRQQQAGEKSMLIKHLKPGYDRPSNPLHADWIILVIIVSAALFSLIRKTKGNLSPGLARFFLFRGINDPVSRDMGGLFHWHSTILNLISFVIIGLFGYTAVIYFDLVPAGFRGIIAWLIALGIICLAVTLRHITCVITGFTSGERDVFSKYLLGVYQSYRVGASILFVIIILMSYTRILPVRDLIISGILVAGLMYILRVIRLLIIFLNKNISIFYLILYLCALEILPVLIVVKYFTGLV
jgi:Domain of unknown function (DUF4271)